MSGASVPSLVPPQAAAPKKPEAAKRSRRYGVWLIVAVLIAGIAWGLKSSRTADTSGNKTGPAPIRTATIRTGTLERTIRIAGTTGAQNYSSLVTPQLRGSRGGYGRDARIASSGQNTNITVVSKNTATTSGSSASGGSSSAAGGTVASTAGTGGSGISAAMQSATSRVSKGGSSGSSIQTPSSASNSSSVGSDGLGSTSGTLGAGSGGGGGGGGDEFNLVLHDLVNPGSLVRKGQTIAEFDRQYMMLRLDDYRASVFQTESSVKRMKAELDVARKAHEQTVAAAKADLDKAKLDLKTIPVLGTMDAERIKLALEEAQASYDQLVAETKFVEIGLKSQEKNANLDLQQAKIELKRAEANADRMVIKAPIDGLTVMQTTFRGSEFSQIQKGDQLFPGQMFMQVVDTSSMVINALMNQVDVESMRIGAKAKIHFDAYPDLELPGHVYAIGAMTKPGGQRANFLKEIPVQIKIDKMDKRVIPDLSVSADVVLETEEKAAAIAPLGGIFSDDNGKTSYVYVQKESGWQKQPVELGTASYVAVSIRSGLKPGDVIALEAPPTPAHEGS